MPWIPASESKIESPAHYQVPYDAEPRYSLDEAKSQRKLTVQHREFCLSMQKEYGREDRELARYYSDEASEDLKQQRGWQIVIDWLTGENGADNFWKYGREKCNKEIARYADRAFNALD